MHRILLLILMFFPGYGLAAFDPATCSQTTIRCVGDGMEYNTDNGAADDSPIFRSAVNASVAGDTIVIRGGTYHHTVDSANLYFVEVDVSGSLLAPITITGAEGEAPAHIIGFGFPENGGEPPRRDEEIFRVNGDHIHLYDLEMSYSSRFGITFNGNYGRAERIHVHDNWHDGVTIGRTGTSVTGTVVRESHFHNMRHGSGVIISRGSDDTNSVSDSIIEYNISYENGYWWNGDTLEKVPAVSGDVAGGGNSDGFGASKNCNDVTAAAGQNDNTCPNNIYRHNIAWHNADDGFDVSIGRGSFLGYNFAFNNGPEGNRGFKVLRSVWGGLSYVGNISIQNVAPSSRGIELRFAENGLSAHNIVLGEAAHGLYISTAPSENASTTRVHNNIEYGNGNPPAITSGTVVSNNWMENSNGAPEIANIGIHHSDIDTNPVAATTTRERRDLIYTQIRNALLPIEGSALIDAGLFLADVHCATANDDAQNPHDPSDTSCKQWIGAAPDIGPFEYGLDGAGTIPSIALPRPPTISIM